MIPKALRETAGRGAGPLARAALAHGARGRVASVHRRAVNLLLADGSLVALLPEGTPLHPWALSVPLDPARFDVGGHFRVEAHMLEIGPTRIALETLQVIPLRLERRVAALRASAMERIASRRPAAAHDGPFEGLLRGALERFEAGGDPRDLAALLGVGEGLTPSGDDIITGVLAGLDLASDPAARALRRALVAAVAPVASERTTRSAAQMVGAAAAGFYAEPVLDLLHALAGGADAPGPVETARDALLAVGHHSGRDTLAGIVAGLGRALAAGSGACPVEAPSLPGGR